MRRRLVIATGHELSLALVENGRVLASWHNPVQKGHAEAIVPAIAELLAPLGGSGVVCDDVIVETGPGSFTGLRIGLAAASALALVWKADLRGVRSTQLVAADVRAMGHDGELLVMLAAPRGQIWVERFAASGLRSIMPPMALTREAARQMAGDAVLCAGSAPAVLSLPGIELQPRATAAAYVPTDELGPATPVYVRISDNAART